MAQVKEAVGSVSTPELDSQTLSPKIVEKTQNVPDETTTAENEICTPSDPPEVPANSAITPNEYEMQKKANITEFKEFFQKDIDEFKKKCAEVAEYGLEKAPPRVVREIPPLTLTTRQSTNRPQIIGKLENLEAKKEEGKRIKLAQQLEMKQARAEKKQKQTKTNDLFKQIMNQDPIIRRFDNLSESSVGTLKRKANKSFDSLGSVSTLSGMKTPLKSDKSDKSVLPDDLFSSSSSTETESPPKAKKFQKMPETTKKSPTPKSETVAPKTKKKPTIVGCDPRTAKIKPYQCYKCNSVFKVKTSVKGHFRVKHTQDTYDSSKVLNVKFQCYNCTQAFDSYGKILKHFELMYPAETLDPKKILVGKTNKSAALLLKLKYGPPPPEIVKKLHGINKNVPSKIKKVIKITKQIYTFKCGDCDFKHSELDKVEQHKLTHLQGK